MTTPISNISSPVVFQRAVVFKMGLLLISDTAQREALRVISEFELDSSTKPLDLPRLEKWIAGNDATRPSLPNPSVSLRIQSLAFLIIYCHEKADEKCSAFLRAIRETSVEAWNGDRGSANPWRAMKVKEILEQGGKKYTDFFNPPIARYTQPGALLEAILAPLNELEATNVFRAPVVVAPVVVAPQRVEEDTAFRFEPIFIDQEQTQPTPPIVASRATIPMVQRLPRARKAGKSRAETATTTPLPNRTRTPQPQGAVDPAPEENFDVTTFLE